MPPRKRSLSVVDPAAPAAPKKPRTIKDAAQLSERELLDAMRAKVAAEIDAGVPAHALAPLMRQLRDLDRDIRAIDSEAGKDGDDVGKAAATPDDDWSEAAI